MFFGERENFSAHPRLYEIPPPRWLNCSASFRTSFWTPSSSATTKPMISSFPIANTTRIPISFSAACAAPPAISSAACATSTAAPTARPSTLPTLPDFFNVPIPQDMQGKPLRDTVASDKSVREYALFGMHGFYGNVTDGRYVLHAHIGAGAPGRPV